MAEAGWVWGKPAWLLLAVLLLAGDTEKLHSPPTTPEVHSVVYWNDRRGGRDTHWRLIRCQWLICETQSPAGVWHLRLSRIHIKHLPPSKQTNTSSGHERKIHSESLWGEKKGRRNHPETAVCTSSLHPCAGWTQQPSEHKAGRVVKRWAKCQSRRSCLPKDQECQGELAPDVPSTHGDGLDSG